MRPSAGSSRRSSRSPTTIRQFAGWPGPGSRGRRFPAGGSSWTGSPGPWRAKGPARRWSHSCPERRPVRGAWSSVQVVRQAEHPVIVAALRTPIGTAGGALATVAAPDLAAPVLRTLAASVPDLPLRDVVLGNCTGPGGDVARVAALTAGLPVEAPALTVDRQCASGLAAVAVAAALLSSSRGIVLAGGVESASTAPLRFWPGDPPRRYDRAPFAPDHVGDPDMGLAADVLAEKAGVTRARQDEYAARSHALACATRDSGGVDAQGGPLARARSGPRPPARPGGERAAPRPP